MSLSIWINIWEQVRGPVKIVFAKIFLHFTSPEERLFRTRFIKPKLDSIFRALISCFVTSLINKEAANATIVDNPRVISVSTRVNPEAPFEVFGIITSYYTRRIDYMFSTFISKPPAVKNAQCG